MASPARALSTGSPEPLWGVAETAAFLGVPETTLYAWASRGGGPRSSRVGRHRRYRREDVESWLDSQVTAGTGVNSTP